MNPSDTPSDAALRLKQLLKEANITSHRLDSATRGITFIGRAREWQVTARLSPDWLNVSTSLFRLPAEAGLRAQLLEWALIANRRLALAKVSIDGEVVVLEIDYRAVHVDAAALADIVNFLFQIGEQEYPAAFRIVSGDRRLEALEASLQPGTSR